MAYIAAAAAADLNVSLRIIKAKLQLKTLLKCLQFLISGTIFLFLFVTVPFSGAIHLQFHSSGNHYVWRKVTSTVHNIIVGKLWIDQV